MTIPAAQVPHYPFDTRPLTEPVDPAAVKAFARGLRQRYPTPTSTIVAWVIVAVVLVFAFVPMIFVMIAVVSGGARLATLMPVLIFAIIAAIAIPVAITVSRKRNTAAYRLSRFAAANGMAYEHRIDAPALPGMIFQQGHSRIASSLLRGRSPRFVEFANYRYTTGSGKNSKTHTWGYVAVKLDVPLPNIVLDALGNNSLGTNLPSSFSKDQHLSLEGDFDRYFTLYCPTGYEADALYLFTPDIMARFIDHAAQLDVEIVDDWMFLYMQRDASTTDAATWAWLFGTVGALMSKFDQWARWRDDRLRQAQAQFHARAQAPQHPVAGGAAPVPGAAPGQAHPFAPPAGMLTPPPGVALQGRRLKKRFNWVILVIIGAVLLFNLFPLFGTVFGVLLHR